jgi:hypothetical protein
MKRWMLLACLLLVPLSALAQFLGLPIADTAKAPAMGETVVSAGGMLGDEFNLYGGRLSFAPLGRLAVFADLGAIDPDGGDVGFAFQLGGKFTLPLNQSNPVDVALRAVWDRAGFDLDAGEVTSSGIHAGVLVSREVKLFSPYAYLGLKFTDSEVKLKGGGKVSDDSTDLAVAAGTLIRLTEPFALYVELAHVDDPFVNFGGCWMF